MRNKIGIPQRYVVLAVMAVWSIPIIIAITQDLYVEQVQGQKSFQVRASGNPLTQTILAYLFWALGSLLILYLSQNVPIRKERWRTSVLFHLVASLLVAALHGVVLLFASAFPQIGHLSQEAFFSVVFTAASSGIHLKIVIYWAVLAAGHAWQFYMALQHEAQQRSRLQENLTKAQLEQLKTQVHPHFLFNTLNTISLLALKKDTAAVREMLENLSCLLRSTLEKTTSEFVQLKKEIEIVEAYLSIEQIRFKDRLRIERCIPSDLLEATVPPLILQPVVENAIKHAVGHKMEGGWLRIAITKQNQLLHLVVEDDGPGITDTWDMQASMGVGLKSVRERMALLYPDSHQITLTNRAEGGLKVHLRLPYQTMKTHSDKLVV